MTPETPAPDTPVAAPAAAPSFFHPASGALILGLDWLLFSGVVFSGGAGLPVSITLGLLLGGLGTFLLQRRAANDALKPALLKASLAALTVGLPFPVAGTMIGGGIVLLSGLRSWRDRIKLPG